MIIIAGYTRTDAAKRDSAVEAFRAWSNAPGHTTVVSTSP